MFARLFACVPCVHVPACVAAAGAGPGFNLWFVCSFLAQTTWLAILYSPIVSLLSPMAPKVRGERRAAERADREAADRRVHQRLDDFETRLDGAESLGRNDTTNGSASKNPLNVSC